MLRSAAQRPLTTGAILCQYVGIRTENRLVPEEEIYQQPPSYFHSAEWFFIIAPPAPVAGHAEGFHARRSEMISLTLMGGGGDVMMVGCGFRPLRSSLRVRGSSSDGNSNLIVALLHFQDAFKGN